MAHKSTNDRLHSNYSGVENRMIAVIELQADYDKAPNISAKDRAALEKFAVDLRSLAAEQDEDFELLIGPVADDGSFLFHRRFAWRTTIDGQKYGMEFIAGVDSKPETAIQTLVKDYRRFIKEREGS